MSAAFYENRNAFAPSLLVHEASCHLGNSIWHFISGSVDYPIAQDIAFYCFSTERRKRKLDEKEISEKFKFKVSVFVR